MMNRREAVVGRRESTLRQGRGVLSSASGDWTISRFAAVADFVAERLGSVRHEQRVAYLAGKLFRLTRKWHGLMGEAGQEALEVLRFGALLHDVGRTYEDARHPQIGARMILGARGLPLTARERRLVAFLARYHRGAVLREGHDEILKKGEWETGVVLLAMLRAADALDSRSHGGATVRMSRDGRRVTLVVKAHEVAAKVHKAVTRRKKYRLMEGLLGCEVKVKVAD